jgi:hypothetical protein
MEKEKYYKYGFPNIIRKKNLISMQDIFNDVNVKSKLFTQEEDKDNSVIIEEEDKDNSVIIEEEEKPKIKKNKSKKNKNII